MINLSNLKKLCTFFSKSPKHTNKIATVFIKRYLKREGRVALLGDMGSGKTFFISCACKQLGVKEPVTSPTFSLLNEYKGKVQIRHIDLYRLKNIDEAVEAGLEEVCSLEGICFIEWPERAWKIIPLPYYIVNIEIISENSRRINIFINQ